MVVAARKQRSAGQHLGKNAPHRPHIDGRGVLLEREHDLRSPIPPGSYVLGHEAEIVLGQSHRAGEAKVTDLEVAVGVQEKITGLEVAMEHIGRMHGFQSPEGLVDEVLHVVVGEFLSADHSMQVGLHEFLDEVYLSKRLVVERPLDRQHRDDVFVGKMLEQLELAERPETEHRPLERLDLLDRYLLVGGLVDRQTNHPICSFANHL